MSEEILLNESILLFSWTSWTPGILAQGFLISFGEVLTATPLRPVRPAVGLA
jgi:hypothetical protein